MGKVKKLEHVVKVPFVSVPAPAPEMVAPAERVIIKMSEYDDGTAAIADVPPPGRRKRKVPLLSIKERRK